MLSFFLSLLAEKKGKKIKGKTLSLGGFLGDDASKVLIKSGGEDGIDAREDVLDRKLLPTAPRAAIQDELNRERVPTEPPFRAFVGNLPYECEDEVRMSQLHEHYACFHLFHFDIIVFCSYFYLFENCLFISIVAFERSTSVEVCVSYSIACQRICVPVSLSVYLSFCGDLPNSAM